MTKTQHSKPRHRSEPPMSRIPGTLYSFCCHVLPSGLLSRFPSLPEERLDMILAFLTRHKNEDAKINASDDDADNHTDTDDDTDNNAADMDANETPNNTDTKENPADDSEESAHCPDEPQPLKTLQQQQIEPEQLIMTTIIS